VTRRPGSVPAYRRLRILALLADRTSTELDSKRLCQVCAEVTAVSGAGIMLISPEMSRGTLWSSSSTGAAIEELQYTLGEGPCLDAYHQDRPVLEPDLADPAKSRWVGFAEAAVGAGVRAIFGFPVEVGSVRLGALNLYCDRPGSLGDEQHADALVMADVVAQAVLVIQAGAPLGALAAELEAGADDRPLVAVSEDIVGRRLRFDEGSGQKDPRR
jgi:hypothetical protein